ncbi:hypothetical protein [Mycolicibacterium wolinskyi]|uniref:hypothetical protein n=1 Tax=Mycolicibacterium wolinskyi TaxID=59750 RepID=UPI0039179246
MGIALAGVLCIAGISYGVGYLMTKGSVDALTDAAQRDTSVQPPTASEQSSAPEAMTIDNALPSEFRSDEYFSDQERVAWAWNQLQQPTNEPGYEGMTRIQAANAKLMKENPLAEKIVEPSLEMTGDQILTSEQSIYYFAATTTELSDRDRAKVIAAAIDNSNPVYDTVMQNVLERDDNLSGVSKVDTSAVNHLPVESPVFKYTVLNNGFDPKGVETKVMNVSLKNVSKDADYDGSKQKYYQFIDGKPIQVYQCDSRDKTLRASNPQNIPAY